MKREKVKYSEEGEQYKLWYDIIHPYEIEVCTSIEYFNISLYQKKVLAGIQNMASSMRAHMDENESTLRARIMRREQEDITVYFVDPRLYGEEAKAKVSEVQIATSTWFPICNVTPWWPLAKRITKSKIMSAEIKLRK